MTDSQGQLVLRALEAANEVKGSVTGLRDGLREVREDMRRHANENSAQHEENKRLMSEGLHGVHERISSLAVVGTRWALGIAGGVIVVLLTILGAVINQGLPWR